MSWQAGTCLSEHVAVVAARVQQQVAAAATDFTWRQQLFTHLADEIGWPLGMDEAQQRWAVLPGFSKASEASVVLAGQDCNRAGKSILSTLVCLIAALWMCFVFLCVALAMLKVV